MTPLQDRLHDVLGKRPLRIEALGGGCIGEVRRVALEGGETVVAKTGSAKTGGDTLDIEAWMLRTLAENGLPVPAVIHADPTLLVMDYIDAGDPITPGAEAHAAELLAALHNVTAPRFGLDRDTVIGPLPQPNPRTADWIGFFRDHRLLHMARLALAAGRLPAGLMQRLETFAARIDEFLPARQQPSLIHGDMWGGNVLVKGDRIAGFVDPAIYYADAEIELAFSTLFSTFGEGFFQKYNDIRPIGDGFFVERRHIYNLYPLLVHTRLFGGDYASSVGQTLARLGF